MAKRVDYDDGLQPASTALTESTRMNLAPSAAAVGGTDAVSVAISEALLEIDGAVAARVARNNSMIASLRLADGITGAGMTKTDEDGAAGIGAAVPQ